MFFRITVCGCLLLQALYAKATSPLQLAQVGNFHLENGQVIRQCQVGYQTLGIPNADSTNAVLVCPWFGGTSTGVANLIRTTGLVDTTRYFVIIIDPLGNGVSSSPSNSRVQRGKRFPLFSIRDIVRAQHTVLTGWLRLHRLLAVTGISMGGMQTLQWMVTYPTFMQKAIPIAGTPRQTAYDKLFWDTQRGLLELALAQPKARLQALTAVAQLNELNLYTPTYQNARTSPVDYPAFLATVQYPTSTDPTNRLYQIRAMIGQDIAPGQEWRAMAHQIRCRVRIIVATHDLMVNPEPARQLAQALGAELNELPSEAGHQSTVTLNMPQLQQLVQSFLDQ